MRRSSSSHVRGVGFSLICAALLLPAPVSARQMVRISIPSADHDPLYVDAQSIRRAASLVHFRYVLDVPVFGEAHSVKRFRSNAMDATIDCARQTGSIARVTEYSERAGAGNMRRQASLKPDERAPFPIDMRAGSTFGYLFRHLCP